LSLAGAQAAGMLHVHDRFMRSLEQAGRLDRALELLPDAEAIGERSAAKLGLTQPELAVLLAYSKVTLYADLLESDLPEDPYLSTDLARYFPAPLPERFAAHLERHRLRREIIATRVANSLVDRAGLTFVFRLREETGGAAEDIARAYAVAREVFEMRPSWEQIEALDNRWQAMARAALRDDLFALHGELTADILQAGPPQADAVARLEAWAAANPSAVERCLAILADIDATGTFDLTTLPVALRELRT